MRRTLRGSVLQARDVRGRRRRRPAGQVDADELGRTRPPRLHRDGGAPAAQEQAQAQHHRPPARRGSCAGRGACAQPLADRPVPDRERRDGERSHSRPLAYAPYPAPRPPALTHSASRLCLRWRSPCSRPTPSSPSSSPSRGRPRRPPCRGVPTLAHTRRLATPHQGAAAVDVCRGCAL